MKNYILNLLEERDIDLKRVAELIYETQLKYCPKLTLEECMETLQAILGKREVQYAILTGLTLDKLAEESLLPSVLQEAVANDEPLFGIDEVIGLSIANLYGTIGQTNFGYLDKGKFGLIRELDSEHGKVNTFADDIVCALVGASAARLVHRSDYVEKLI